MVVLAGAFVAGVLTTLAPCVLPLLPVIVGTGVTGRRRALVVTLGLAVSVVAFTLLLKASTLLIEVPLEVWSYLAGGLLVVLGLVALFPSVWEAAGARLGLQARANAPLAAAQTVKGDAGAALTGAALGPVFSSCSPLYGYVVVTVIPARPAYGLLLLATYTIGMCGTLLAVALAGGRLIRRLGWLADTRGTFRRALGFVFVLVGVVVILGWDREVQAWVIEHAPVRPWDLDQGFIPEE